MKRRIQAELLDRLVREAQSTRRLPSVSATVVVRGETVYSGAVGIADADGRPATADTVYRIGSITKTFTAAAVHRLAGSGALELDDALEAHLPEAAAFARAAGGRGAVTIARLLAHASGLQRELPGDAWETLDFRPVAEVLADAERVAYVLAPGRAWHYSNLAYALLGEVVTRLAGRPFSEVIAGELFPAAHLVATAWTPPPGAARGYLVDPYADVLREEAVLPSIGAFDAAGSLWSTTPDLCRWGAYLAGQDAMHDVRIMAETDAWLLAWGLGLMLHRRGDRILFGHGGAMPGHLAALVCSRKEDVQVAVLTNASTPPAAPEELAMALVDVVLDELPAAPEEWQPGPPVPGPVASMLGSWWSEGSELHFRWRGGRLESVLVVGSPRQKPSVFEEESPDCWRVVQGRERGEILAVERDAHGNAVRMIWAGYPLTRAPETFGAGP